MISPDSPFYNSDPAPLPEHKLWGAVLARAIVDYIKNHSNISMHAYALTRKNEINNFFFSDREPGFMIICEAVFSNPYVSAIKIRKFLKAGKFESLFAKNDAVLTNILPYPGCDLKGMRERVIVKGAA